MTLREAIGQYIAWRRAQGARFQSQAYALRRYCRRVGDGVDCDAVRSDQVSVFLASGTPASSNQVFLYCTLASFYRYAITRSLATRSPLPVEAPKAPPSAPPYIYSHDELRRLLDAVKTYRKRVNQLEPHTFRALLLVLYGAGLRRADQTHGASLRIRVSKYLFPHGCLWWRECPNCGKLSSYIGDDWRIDPPSLLPPPPLNAFVKKGQFRSWVNDEKEHWDRGEVDARACVHCTKLTYAHHTPLMMQTSFKTAPPPFLEEIQREMRVVVQEAHHIILMGYSLPPDDVTYRAFFAARIPRSPESGKYAKKQVRCSVVGKEDGYDRRWFYPDEFDTKGDLPDAVTHARDLFGAANVRFFGGGIPEVFLDSGGSVSKDEVEQLLIWEKR